MVSYHRDIRLCSVRDLFQAPAHIPCVPQYMDMEALPVEPAESSRLSSEGGGVLLVPSRRQQGATALGPNAASDSTEDFDEDDVIDVAVEIPLDELTVVSTPDDEHMTDCEPATDTSSFVSTQSRATTASVRETGSRRSC